MIFKHLKSGVLVEDEYFDAIYPKVLRMVSEFHFTPVRVAKYAAQSLVQHSGMRVLDIGSGAGKFCMVGAACTNGHFTGVEQREPLHKLSLELAQRYGLPNVSFVHSNITNIKFEDFDAFYFYNSFYENINRDSPIDFTVSLDKQLYINYSLFVREKLDGMPPGTILATYFSENDEVPDSYKICSTYFGGYLKIWKKKSDAP